MNNLESKLEFHDILVEQIVTRLFIETNSINIRINQLREIVISSKLTEILNFQSTNGFFQKIITFLMEVIRYLLFILLFLSESSLVIY